MAEGRERSEWARASAIMAMIHNVQCAKKADMKSPAAFDPFTAKAASKPMKVPLASLREMFVRKGFKPQAGKVSKEG